MLDELVERGGVVARLLLRDLRVVLVTRRHAVIDVEAHVLVADLALVVAHREHASVDRERGCEVLGVEALRRGPRDKPEREEEDAREDRDDDRLLAALALPPRHALALGETREADATCHGDL